MKNLSLTCPMTLGEEKEIIKNLEDNVVAKYLPGLQQHWKKMMKWIIAFRIIFTLLFLGIIFFIYLFYGSPIKTILLQIRHEASDGVFWSYFYKGFSVFFCGCLWYAITFHWIKTSPGRFKWFKEVEKKFRKDFESAFDKKRKELYESIFHLVMPTVEVDYTIEKKGFNFWGNEKLQNLTIGKKDLSPLCCFYPWDSTEMKDCCLSHPDFSTVTYLTQVYLDFDSKTATVILEGDTLNLKFPYVARELNLLEYAVEVKGISVVFSITADKEHTLAENILLAEKMLN